MMMTFLLQKEEEKHVTSILAMVKAESPVCTINNTSGQVVASLWVKVWVKVAVKQVRWILISWIRTVCYQKKFKN